MEVQACFRSSPIHLWVTGELNLHSQIRTQHSRRKRRRDTSRKAATAPVTRASARVQVNLHFQFTVKIEASTSTTLAKIREVIVRSIQHFVFSTNVPKSTNGMAPEDVQNLIYLLIDEYNARTFVDGKPKDPKLWQQIAQKLDIPDYPGISGVQVMGKVNSLKQDYKAFQFLKDQTGVGWDEEKDTVDADDGWWDLKSQANPNITKFKNKGLANYPELHLLFAYSTASGALRQSSVQRAPTPEECARRERAVRDRHGGFHNVDEEHIASGGGVNLSCGGVQSMDTSSSSRKRGSASVMGARQRRKAKPTSEELYYDEVRNFIIGRRDRDGAGSSGHSGGMKECIAALQSLNPRLPIEQFTVVVRYLTGNRDAQEAFLAMDDDIKGDWARYVK
ncbi:hypothetical protein CJ030_MR2G013637 [Morella rubra]|uniref:Myb/SANT-like domain-containing protein n=1 Tax=Morella rubra TaxID=262757 RepID=A0A6A1WDD0_9ROSI|nr:hypothetical protein CJ030_MR2G013637 [Morella rubra]